MPHFSNRRGVSSSGSSEERERRPGQRSGGVAPCRARLKGWLRNVASRSPIWGDVDLAAFCRITGYSREHATRELSKIRAKDHDLVFETKLRDKKPNGRRTWGVIVAQRAKLKFDKCSLFYDAQGYRLHNYTTLGVGGEKIDPAIVLHPACSRPRGRPPKLASCVVESDELSAHRPKVSAPRNSATSWNRRDTDDSAESTGGCDIPYIRKDSFGIQQPELNGARRDLAQWRGGKEDPPGRKPVPQLRQKPFPMLDRLAGCHWDN